MNRKIQTSFASGGKSGVGIVTVVIAPDEQRLTDITNNLEATQRRVEQLEKQISSMKISERSIDRPSSSGLEILQAWLSQFIEKKYTMEQLTNLEQLDLDDNQITKIPPEIGQLTNLKRLYLAGNQITEIPPEIGQLTNLRELYLYDNQITEIPREVGQLTNLKWLFLYDNQITEIPREVGQLTNLKCLALNNNQITEISPEIGQLTNLTFLDLGYNKITEIPPDLFFKVAPSGSNSAGKEIGQLINLKYLDLQSNQISEIPPEIGQLMNLERLILAHNQITEIPKEIRQLTNLEILPSSLMQASSPQSGPSPPVSGPSPPEPVSVSGPSPPEPPPDPEYLYSVLYRKRSNQLAAIRELGDVIRIYDNIDVEYQSLSLADARAKYEEIKKDSINHTSGKFWIAISVYLVKSRLGEVIYEGIINEKMMDMFSYM